MSQRLRLLLDALDRHAVEVRLLPLVPELRHLIPEVLANVRVTWHARGVLQVAELEVHPHVCRGPLCVLCDRLVVRRMDPEEASEKDRAPRLIEPPPRGMLRIGRGRDR